ncbi:MAG: type I restriction enzyme HsdR N-terminal domain-containing protein [Bacteroidetes bacterium]|nr:type I restriction enzyme HsdR N-terminal domain-containing protein [Bacteroidota bacterium]
MPAPEQLAHLIERFARNRDDYHRGQFNETQLRVDYLNPVFELLGWDVINKAGYAEKYRDVIHEAQVKVGGMTKAPDYCFKIGPERKFFLEAKKPAVNIKENREPAFQLRRYAWSAKLPLSILTDFEEIAVYDCRVKPDRLDRASVARIMYFTFEQFAEKWDEFAAIFSKEAVLQGSFDRYAESAKAKRGTAEVDGAFLEEIESWRDMLAKDIAKRNEELSQSDLNDAVQRTIDRIIFLRICEDRGIEEYGRLLSLRNGANIYPRLMQIFHQADARYNSGLFHFKQERGQAEQPDELTPDLVIDDRPLKEIFRRLYYPESAYEFSVFPASILGQVSPFHGSEQSVPAVRSPPPPALLPGMCSPSGC